MNTSELLLRARDILAQPDAWAVYNYACNADGDGVDVFDAAATAFCAVGALAKAGGDMNWCYNDRLNDAIDVVLEVAGVEYRGFNALIAWNDERDRTQETVVATFDQAIAALALR